ncbi:MAG: 4Fe-4S binding protein, partial [Deltaproteobacteria bacterium]|nr:4Fe-4S binding protein [Deltaproteobacteria bacterium]
GPLYRGGGLFMPILFAVTVLLVGPGWCSFLCYVGAWDLNASHAQPKARELPPWRHAVRVGLLLSIVAAALSLNALGAPVSVAAALGLAFGLAGVAVMVLASRRWGTMAHCVVWCPIGLLATVLGRLSPFRVRIRSTCEECNVCATSCRYDALRPVDIARRRPALGCTLCGDCLSSCGRRSLEYSFPGLKARSARAAYLVLVASLHAVFLGVARI